MGGPHQLDEARDVLRLNGDTVLRSLSLIAGLGRSPLRKLPVEVHLVIVHRRDCSLEGSKIYILWCATM